MGSAHCTSGLHWTQELQTSTILHSSCNAELQQTPLVIKTSREKGIALLHLARGLYFLLYFKQHVPTFIPEESKSRQNFHTIPILPFCPIQPRHPQQMILSPSKCPLCHAARGRALLSSLTALERNPAGHRPQRKESCSGPKRWES